MLALYNWLVGIIVFRKTSILFPTSASMPVHATLIKYVLFIFPKSICVFPLGSILIALYVSFPEPEGIIPSLFFVPIIPGNVLVKVPSPPTIYITFSSFLYSNAISAPLKVSVMYLIS